MKRLFLITFAIVLTITNTSGQSDCTQSGSANCENNTHTDPNPTYTSPMSNDFKQNTFDWTSPTFPVNKPGFGTFQPIGPFNYDNPFYSTNLYLQRIAGGQKSDFAPQDGWELIKQDFGYAYSNGQWNGTSLPVIENNQVLAQGSILNYFILYNKYTGVLRLLGSHPNQSNPKSGIIVHIEIVHPEISGFEDRQSYSHYASNGLFALNASTSTALDKKTNNLKTSATAISPSFNGSFFYADFQLSYDPCVCLFEGGLKFSFEDILSYDVKASGLSIGSNVSLGDNNGNVFDISNSFTSQMSFVKTGSLISSNWYNPKSLTQHFADIDLLLNKLNSTGDFEKEKNEINTGIRKIPNILHSDSLSELKKSVETLSKYIDYASYDETVNGRIKTRTVSTYLNLNGELRAKERLGYEFYLATPSSCNADSRDEYTKLNIYGTIPMYPMYNEPLGLSAMLYTPRIYRTLTAERIDDCGNCKNPSSKRCQRKCNSNSSKKVRRVENLQEFYKLDNNSIKLAFHPLIDTEKTQVDAAIEIFGIDDSVVESDKDHFLDKTTLHCSKLDELEGIGRYRTSFLPLQCIDELVFGVGHSFFGNKNKHNEVFTKARSKSFLVLNIYYVFKEDAYGKVHTGVQTIKYPLEIIESLEDLSNHPNIDLFAEKELYDSICKDKPKTYVSSSELTTFCKSESYRAKEVNLEPNKLEEHKENILIASKNIASIYPNPSNGTFAILFEKQTIINHTLTIIDPLGREVYKQVLDRGSQKFEIQRNNLPAGVYFLSITHACEKQTFKIIIQNP